MRRRDITGFLLYGAANTRGIANAAVVDDASSPDGPFVLLRRYGSNQGGLQKACAAAAASGGAPARVTTLIIDTAVPITSSFTIPAAVCLKFIGAGQLQVAGGVTVTYLGMVEDCLNHIFDLVGSGVVYFGASRQRSFRPEWWGALGNGGNDGSNDYDAVVACLTQAGTYPKTKDAPPSGGQARVLLNGNYPLHRTITVPNDVEMVGVGSSMETGFTLIGVTQIVWPNFRSMLRNALIQIDRCSASPAVSFDSSSGACYNNALDTVAIRGVNSTRGNQVGIEFARCQAVVARSLRVEVTDGASSSTGIRISSGCLGLELTSPDVEACSTCISTEGTGSVTIDNPYIERHTIYGIHVTGTGFVNIRAGNVLNPTSQQDAVVLDNCCNCTVDGVDTGTTGAGVVALHGSAPFINVNVRGVPANRIVDRNRYLQVSDAGPFSGSVVLVAAASARIVFAVTAPHALYAVTLSQSTSSPSPPWITDKTALGFQINFAVPMSGTVTWTVTI